MSGRLLSLLDVDLWGDHADQVKQDMVARTGKEEANRRRLHQDFLAAVYYLPSSLVARLESDRKRAQVLELLCAHLVKLGLRHPSEKTIGLILALAFFTFMGWLSKQAKVSKPLLALEDGPMEDFAAPTSGPAPPTSAPIGAATKLDEGAEGVTASLAALKDAVDTQAGVNGKVTALKSQHLSQS
eukprot:s645_g13.t1